MLLFSRGKVFRKPDLPSKPALSVWCGGMKDIHTVVQPAVSRTFHLPKLCAHQTLDSEEQLSGPHRPVQAAGRVVWTVASSPLEMRVRACVHVCCVHVRVSAWVCAHLLWVWCVCWPVTLAGLPATSPDTGQQSLTWVSSCLGQSPGTERVSWKGHGDL